MKYICDNCKKIVEEEDMKIYKEYYENGTCDCYFENCSCGGEFQRAIPCKFCNEPSLNGVCDDCINFENAIEFGNEHKAIIQINGYIASEFEESEIEEILKNHLIEAQKIGKKLNYKDFFEKEL